MTPYSCRNRNACGLYKILLIQVQILMRIIFNINIYQYSKICFIDNSTFYSKKNFEMKMWVVKIWTVNKSVILEILIHYKD